MENKMQKANNDRITEEVFDLLLEGKTVKEAKERTGAKDIQINEEETVLTIEYPDGEIISHWV